MGVCTWDTCSIHYGAVCMHLERFIDPVSSCWRMKNKRYVSWTSLELLSGDITNTQVISSLVSAFSNVDWEIFDHYELSYFFLQSSSEYTCFINSSFETRWCRVSEYGWVVNGLTRGRALNHICQHKPLWANARYGLTRASSAREINRALSHIDCTVISLYTVHLL